MMVMSRGSRKLYPNPETVMSRWHVAYVLTIAIVAVGIYDATWIIRYRHVITYAVWEAFKCAEALL